MQSRESQGVLWIRNFRTEHHMRLRQTGFSFVFSSSFSFGLSFAFSTDAGKADADSETVVAAVSTLAIENSLSLSDELEEALEVKKCSVPTRVS